ncbi:hypothetical protein quinque_010006 [Culex quinquefasciatus]
MRRSLRKRKRSEDVPAEAVAPPPAPVSPAPASEQSDEPPVQQPSPQSTCNLCKKLSTDLRSDPETADKIIDCLGLGISPEVDPTGHICAGCAERVDMQHAFRTRALHCNSYVENGLDDKEDEDVCRFCLKADGGLVELFPGGNVVAEEVERVRDCLGVEINSWDSVTKLCGDCVGGVEELAGFRAEFSPTAVPVKLEDVMDSSDSYSIGSENGDGVEGFESDGSTAAEGEKGGEKRKITARSLPWIGSDHEDRNFDVLDETDEAVEVVFEEYPFDLRLVLPDGSSLWHCVQCKLRDCRVKLKIDAKGMLATFGGSIDKHNHMNELDKLMECPEGKGMVHFDGKEQPFWLLYGERQRSQYTRSLIFAGQKYLLQSIRFKGLIGVWKCHHVFRKCTALLRIDPLFEKFEMRGRHNHPPLAQWEIDHALRLRGIRDGSLEAIRTYQRTTSRVAIEKRADQEGYVGNGTHTSKSECANGAEDGVQAKVKDNNVDIYKILQQKDPARNFKVLPLDTGFKVVDEDNYEFCFSTQLEDNSTLWKCAMSQLRNCKAVAQVSLDGRQLTFIERKHNHETRPLELLNYPLGKRVIAGEAVWLLKWFNANHESRRVLYRGYLYTLHEIGKHGIIRWRCLRRQSCAAILLSEGDFRKMEVKGEHTHLGLPQSSMDSLVKDTEPTGRRVQKSVEQPATAQPLPMPIYTTISQQNPEKNYTVKQIKKQLLVVTFDGRDFRFNAKESTGYSQWSCVWSDIRLCKVKLYISPDGKVARLHESDHKHNHSDGDVPAFKLTDGKRTIFDETKNVDLPYYLYTYPADFFPNRGLIYQGQKYTLCRIDRHGHSTWKCPRTCTGYIKVESSLRSIACKNSHQHAVLTPQEIKTITGSDQPDLLEGASFPDTPSTSTVPIKKGPLSTHDLLEILSTQDPDRNFQVQIKNRSMKIVQNGFEYYYNLSTAKFTSWKCIYTTVRACRATVTLDNSCKSAHLPEIPRHSHSTKPWSLLTFPLGRSTIIDAQTGAEKPFWFRLQPNFLRPIVTIMYEGHRYRLVFLNESGSSSTWGCSSSRRCNVRIFIDGLFKRLRNGNSIHTEPAMSASDQVAWIEEIGTIGGEEAVEQDL